MTITSGLFNSINGDRKYDAKWFAQYFATFIGNGVFPNPSTGLQVVEGTNMTTVVKAGKGWIEGYFIVNDADYVLTHDIADGVLKRIDRVVMRLNYLTRQIEVVVKKGIFASTPVAQILQRDADYYELALADVFIANGATQITQAQITDTRLNTALCGIVHGTVNQVDTTSIFNQYQAWFNQITSGVEAEIDAWQVAEKADFDAWFATIQGILDGDIAANLAQQIAELMQSVSDLSGVVTTHTAQDTLIKHKAQQISVVNPETASVEDLQTFSEKLFTSVSNGKNEIGTAITDVDDNLVVPTNPTFQNLADLIGSISTGKKWASGVVIAGSSYSNFALVNGTINSYLIPVQVSGIAFKPKVVIITNTTPNGPLSGVALDMNSAKWQGYSLAFVAEGQTIRIEDLSVGRAYVTDSGFRLPVRLAGSYNWIAIE